MEKEESKLIVPQMLLIGAFGRNSGKTTLACRIIETWKTTALIYAVKIIGIEKANGICHRGQAGCGICTSLKGCYELVEDKGEHPSKDTAQMLGAGAEKSFLLKSLKECMAEAFSSFLENVPAGAVIVAESNTLRKHVIPGAFVFASMEQPEEAAMKISAREVYEYADFILRPEEALNILSLKKNASGHLYVGFRTDGKV